MTVMMSTVEYRDRVAALLARPLFSGPHLGRALPPGWLPLIERLTTALEALPDGNALRCVQLKTKLGGLRCYLEGSGFRLDNVKTGESFVQSQDDPLLADAQELVLAAEAESLRLCMVCGAPEEQRPEVWVTTACDEHASLMRGDVLADYRAVVGDLLAVGLEVYQ